MTRRYAWLRRFIPTILALFFVLDVGLRLLPLEVISFRAWETLTQYAPYDAPFEPNRRFQTEQEFGDLANLGNVPKLREYRAGTTFTIDSLGFRNTPGPQREGAPDAILNGDSFGVGATVSDGETPAAQLRSLTGCRIYSAAGGLDLQVAEIIALAQQLGMKSGLVIDIVLENAIFLRSESARPVGTYERLVSMVPSRLQGLAIRVRGLWTVSPLQILITRGVRLLEDDRILPNSYGSMVIQRTLRDGQKILFVRDDIEYARNILFVSMDRWIRFSSTLEKAGLKLVVVLVPRKYTVYQPLLLDEDPLPSDQLGGTLARLEREIQGIGVPVVNLTAAMRAHAARELERGRYIYWRDDTHWNARGIALATSEISRAWAGEFATHCRSE